MVDHRTPDEDAAGDPKEPQPDCDTEQVDAVFSSEVPVIELDELMDEEVMEEEVQPENQPLEERDA